LGQFSFWLVAISQRPKCRTIPIKHHQLICINPLIKSHADNTGGDNMSMENYQFSKLSQTELAEIKKIEDKINQDHPDKEVILLAYNKK